MFFVVTFAKIPQLLGLQETCFEYLHIFTSVFIFMNLKIKKDALRVSFKRIMAIFSALRGEDKRFYKHKQLQQWNVLTT